MTKHEDNVACQAAGRSEDVPPMAGPVARPLRSFSSGHDPVGAGFAAIMLIQHLAPSLLRDQSFRTIPGGIRLQNSSEDVDLVVSAGDALMEPDFASLDAMVAITGRSMVLLCDGSTGISVKAIILRPERVEIRTGRLWTDLLDPVLRIIDCSRGLDWAASCCMELNANASPSIKAPPDYGAFCRAHGFEEAALRVNRWRSELCGEF